MLGDFMHKLSRSLLVLLIFLNGYISLSLELLILRQLDFFVGSSAVITSIIMAIFLGFMSLGYFVGESSRVSDKQISKILSHSFIIIALFSIFSASFAFVTMFFGFMYLCGVTSGAFQTFIFSLIFLSIGPFLFGFNTTLLSRLLRAMDKKSVGNIMAWDTIGSVIGSIATTLILMPFVGVNNTVFLMTVLAVLCALLTRRNWIVCTVGVAMVLFSGYINSNSYQYNTFGILVNNANSTISVFDSGANRTLYMNGLPMSVLNYQDNQMADYINYLDTNFIYNMPSDHPRKILVLGAGGFTLGLRDTFHDYTFIDIEHTLQDISETHFLKQKLTPNKKFIVQDASQFLKNTPDMYDFILLDVYSNSYQVPESFLTYEFMQRLKSRVAQNGVIAVNMIVEPEFSDAYSRVFDNTFRSVFPYNTSRQIIGDFNPWLSSDGASNVIYVYYNIENDGRIYTIDKTPVIYDR